MTAITENIQFIKKGIKQLEKCKVYIKQNDNFSITRKMYKLHSFDDILRLNKAHFADSSTHQ